MILRHISLLFLVISSYGFASSGTTPSKKTTIKRIHFAPYAEYKTYTFGESTVSLAKYPVQLPNVKSHEPPSKPEKSASHNEWCQYRDLLKPWGNQHGSKLPKKCLGDYQHLPELITGQKVSYQEKSGVVLATQDEPLQDHVTVKLDTQDIIECLVSDLTIVPERKLNRYQKEYLFYCENEADKTHTKEHGTPFEKFIEHRLHLATKRSADYRPYHEPTKSGYLGSCWQEKRRCTGDSRVRHQEIHAANLTWETPCKCQTQWN